MYLLAIKEGVLHKVAIYKLKIRFCDFETSLSSGNFSKLKYFENEKIRTGRV